jgi:hypothetical protein
VSEVGVAVIGQVKVMVIAQGLQAAVEDLVI